MKIISLVLASVLLVSMTSANSIGSRELTNKIELGSILTGILNCLLKALEEISKEDLPAILKELQEALGKLGHCVDINAQVPDLLGIIQCILDNVANISKEDLAEIVKRLQPILLKLNGGLTCIRNLINEICKIDICGPLAFLCNLNLPDILGFLLNTVLDILKGVITSLLTNGVCKGIALPNTDLITALLKGLLECLKKFVGSHLIAFLNKIKDALGPLGDCVDINSPVLDVDVIVQCLLSRVHTISANDLVQIVIRLVIMLLNFQAGLSCLITLIQNLCKVNLCDSLDPLLAPLCKSLNISTIDISKIVDAVLSLLKGVCKVLP